MAPNSTTQSFTKRTRRLRVVRSRAMGMCFGVRDAIEATRIESDPGAVTVRGELVHNEQVLGELADRGFRHQPENESDRIPATERVLVTAHGISDRDLRALVAAGKTVVDTTCPLVRIVHAAAQRFAAQGDLVVVLGKPGHVEVRGITGDLERFAVVESEVDVQRWRAARIGVVSQSTTTPDDAERLLAAIRRANPDADVRYADTICRPTRERQEAIEELLAEVEAVVVVGGKNSNNTRQLVRKAHDAGVPALHVQDPDGVCAEWLAPFDCVGLTAGTSTPDDSIDAVHRRLLELADRR